MQLSVSAYIPGVSPVHRLDARVKIVLLAVYSVCLFLVDTWAGTGLFALIFLGAFAVSGIPARRLFGLVVPVYVLAGLTIVFNMFVFATPEMLSNAARAVAAGDTLAGIYPLASAPDAGGFAFTVPGLLRGCFFAARILLLVFASLVVTFTSTSTELTVALNRFMAPLRRAGVPTDDVATVFSIALRFIPVTAEEFCRVRDAQWSRGSKFGEGSLWQRLRAWQTVLVPLFVGLFRRADVLAQAMDARCYGASAQRTSLKRRALNARDVTILILGAALCIIIAAVL